jgi:S1-C subfamily serine protease/peroxiredoxin
MPIKVKCGKCQSVISAPDSSAGKRAKCPKCAEPLQIPAANASPTVPQKPTANTAAKQPAQSTGPGAKTPAVGSVKPRPQSAPPPSAIDNDFGLGGAGSTIEGELDLKLPLNLASQADPVVNLAQLPAADWSSGKSSSGGTPIWVKLAGGGAAVLVLLVVGQLVFSALSSSDSGNSVAPAVAVHSPDPAAAQPSTRSAPLVASTPLPSTPAPPQTMATAPAENPPPASVPNGTAPDEADSPKPLSEAQVLQTVRNGIGLVTALDATGHEIAYSTGFLIDGTGLMVTDYRAIKYARSARARFRDGSVMIVQGYHGYDIERNIAILQLSGLPKTFDALKLQTSKSFKDGNEVIAIGYSSEFDLLTAKGTIHSLNPTSGLPKDVQDKIHSPPDDIWIQSDALIDKGATGGPLLNMQGEVVGLNCWALGDQKLGLALHASHIFTLIDTSTQGMVDLRRTNSAAGSGGWYRIRDPQFLKLAEEIKTNDEQFHANVRQLEAKGAPEKQVHDFVKANDPVPRFISHCLQLARTVRGKPAELDCFALVVRAIQFPIPPYPNEKTPERKKKDELPKTTPEAEGFLVGALNDVTDGIISRYLDNPLAGDLLLDLMDIEVASSRIQSGMADCLRKVAGKHSMEPRVPASAGLSLAYLLSIVQSSYARHEPEIVTVLQRILKDYPDVPIADTTFGNVAERFLFEVQNLGVGKQAPDIVGLDSAGEELKLSDLRGKIVVLNIFGAWSDLWIDMYPELRDLVENNKDKPLAVVGVNADPKEKFPQISKDININWRCWLDGSHGPIAHRWNATTIPYTYILDPKGVIRFRYAGRTGGFVALSVDELLTGKKGPLDATPAAPAQKIDLEAELDKLAAEIKTRPIPELVDAAMALVQSQRNTATKRQLSLVETWINQGLEAEPDSFSLHMAAAQALLMRDDVPGAVKRLRALLPRQDLEDAQVVTLKNQLARVLVTQSDDAEKDAKEAFELIEDAIRRGGEQGHLIHTRAMTFWALNQLPQARTDLTTILLTHPEPMAYFHLALVESSARNGPAARENLQRSLMMGLKSAPLSDFEQKQLARLAKSLGIVLGRK